MKKLITALAVLSMLALCGSSALAGPIRHDEDDAGVWLYIASWVQVDFDNDTGFFLDIEAGHDTSEDAPESVKDFTVHKNCAATVTGALVTRPSGTPASIVFSHFFNGNPMLTSVTYPTMGEEHGTVQLVASGNDVDTIPAGLWKHGVFRLSIDALNPEPSTAPFTQPL